MNDSSFGTAVRAAVVFALGTSFLATPAQAAALPSLIGSVVGSVRDSLGVPQMGAIVELYNRHDKKVSKAITNAGGEFVFDALLPDTYSLRVNVPSFMPALRRNILVQPGIRSVLAINLASMLSSIELVYSAPSSGTLMSDDWKWVLRGSMSSRPVLRMVDVTTPNAHRQAASIFSDTRGLVSLSSGESAPFSAGGMPDLGTSFALATSVFGSNQFQVSGKIGYGLESEMPSAAFRTSFSRANASGPELKLTMQQVALPTRAAGLVGGYIGNAPALRTLSVTLIEHIEVADGIAVDYGTSLDSVTFLDRLNYMSPFARVTYNLGEKATLVFGYSSGAPPVDLLSRRDTAYENALQDDLVALTTLPRVSLRNGGANVQRTQNLEMSYNAQVGTRSYSIGYFRESTSNAALTLSAPQDFYMGDLLPDVVSNSSVFNIGNYQRTGFTASATQVFGENYSVTVSAGRGGVLTAEDRALETGSPDELRSLIRPSQRHWARGRIAGVAPISRTRFVASYEWTDHQSLTPGHVYLTQRISPQTGLNARIRQPLPCFGGLPGRLEATAEFQNMLAQGYLPITTADGRRILLSHTPRSVRGGFSFIF